MGTLDKDYKDFCEGKHCISGICCDSRKEQCNYAQYVKDTHENIVKVICINQNTKELLLNKKKNYHETY